MLAISTSWKSKEATNGYIFFELLESFDITGRTAFGPFN
jgi:hypothetical protein